jgi:hypothetical protein
LDKRAGLGCSGFLADPLLRLAGEQGRRGLKGMFLLFRSRRGRRGRVYIAVRLVLVVAFLVAVFAFHAHGTTLVILQVARVALLVAVLGTAWLARRRRAGAPFGESD